MSDPPRRRLGWVFVVSSPSGGGKTTVVQRLLGMDRTLVRSVSVTTRSPRRGERAGRDYRFVSPVAFEQMRRAGRLLEWARVHGALYGTPEPPIRRALARGRDVILSLDVQGARQVRHRLGGRAVLLFLLPRSMPELRRRLIQRGTDSPEAIRRRLREARAEVACARWYDYAIVNDRLHEAVRRLKAVIMAQHCRAERITEGGAGWQTRHSRS